MTDGVFAGAIHRRSLIGKARVIRRLVLLLLWTAAAAVIQSVCLLLPGAAKRRFARRYWATFSRLLGMRVRLIGSLATGDQPVVFVSNHSSWVDIAILGGTLPGCFVAKGEVASWPLIGTVARLGRTVFISRQRGTTARERDAMHVRLAEGDNLILFPEGTTSDGARVLPFHTSFFAIAAMPEMWGADQPLIQPVSIVYDRLSGLPATRTTRPLLSWYGDMDIASHYWRLGQQCGVRASVLLHPPLDPALFANRKELSRAVWRIVADGAATLRQNRAVAVSAMTAPPRREQVSDTA